MKYKLIILSPYANDKQKLLMYLDHSHSAYYFDSATNCVDYLHSLNSPFILVLSSKIDDIPYINIIQNLSSIDYIFHIIVYSTHGTIQDISSSIKNGVYNFIVGDNCFEQISDSVNSLEEQNTIFHQDSFSSRTQTLPYSLITNLLNDKYVPTTPSFQNIYESYTTWYSDQLALLPKTSILIIEDELIYLELLHDMIAKTDNYNIFKAQTGTEALTIIKNQKPHIIFLDLFLPDTDGISLLKKIKALVPNTQVIVITAFDLLDSASDIFKIGICNYIRKPVLKKDLLNSLSTAVNIYQSNYIKDNLLATFCNQFLSYKEKTIFLEELLHYTSIQNKTLTIEDLYLFFPELKQKNISLTVPINTFISISNIEKFISSLR